MIRLDINCATSRATPITLTSAEEAQIVAANISAKAAVDAQQVKNDEILNARKALQTLDAKTATLKDIVDLLKILPI